MKDFTTFFLVLILLSVFYLYLETKALKVTYVESMGQRYLVRDLPDKKEAGKLLGNIVTNLQKLVDHLVKEKNNVSASNEDIERLKENFRPDAISESSPGNSYTSYSINKGEKIVFCLRSKKNGNKLMDLNTMMFVAIHEMAHLMTKEIGHPPVFWENMKFLLKHAIQIGIYKKQSFSKNPVDYCGMTITDTPLE